MSKSIAEKIVTSILDIKDSWTSDQGLRAYIQGIYFRLYGAVKDHGPEDPHEKSLMASMQTAEARFDELRDEAGDNRDDADETTEEVERAARTYVLRKEAYEEAEILLSVGAKAYKKAFNRDWNGEFGKRDFVAEANGSK